MNEINIEDTFEYKRGYFQALRDVWILHMGLCGNLDNTPENMRNAIDMVNDLKNRFGIKK